MEHLTAPGVFLPILIILWFCRESLPLLRRTLTEKALLPTTEPHERRGRVDRADWQTALTIAGTFFVFASWRLGTPSQQYFDEVHHVRTAMEFVVGQNPHEWTHPHLAKLCMAAGLLLFGQRFDPSDGVWSDKMTVPFLTAFAWRLPSVLFGAMTLLVFYALARSLFQNRAIATAATILLSLDGVFFVHARIGMTNIYLVCFMLLATLGTWLYMKHGDRRFLLVTGLGLGLALSTRWTSLWAWGFNGLLLLWYYAQVEIPRWQEKNKPLLAMSAGWATHIAVVMFLFPLPIYAVSYVPFVLQGNGSVQTQLFTDGEPRTAGGQSTADWSKVWKRDHYASGHGWYKVVNQQKDMWNYHAELKEPHPYSSTWWSWPLMLRPVWYFFESPQGSVMGIWAIGNAVIWWCSVPVLLCTSFLAWRERSTALGLVSLFGLGMWLAWAIKPRPLIFMHYYFEAVPFACLALAYLGWRLWHHAGKEGQRFVQGVGYAAAGWFVFYYPLLSALPTPDWYFRLHLWFDRLWI